MNRRIFILLAALCLISIGCSDSPKYTGPPLLLKPSYPPGRYRVNIRSDLSSYSKTPRRTIGTYASYSSVLIREVGLPDDNGVQTIRVAYERLQTKQDYEGKTRTFDSDYPDTAQDPEFAERQQAIADTTVLITIGSDCLIRKVEGMEKIVELEMDPAIGLNPPSESVVEHTLAEHMIGCGAYSFPDRPVSPGDEWQHTRTKYSGVVGQLEFTVGYRFLDVEETGEGMVAVIEAKTDLEQTDPVSTWTYWKPDRLNLRSKSLLRFNVASGMLVSITSDEEITVHAHTIRPHPRANGSRHWLIQYHEDLQKDPKL
jgi:hypothetical protein